MSNTDVKVTPIVTHDDVNAIAKKLIALNRAIEELSKAYFEHVPEDEASSKVTPVLNTKGELELILYNTLAKPLGITW